MTGSVASLIQHFEAIYREHMQDLPIVNSRLQVEAVGFRDYAGHQLGVLITPWFMNLVLLPASTAWADSEQGSTENIAFPSGPIQFTIAHDELLGCYLTAVLFRTTADLPDQDTAREIAAQIMQDLFVDAREQRSVSRRALFTGLRAS
jgi:[NiFe] hydrogenase assembly HybE family chaperone